MLKGRTAVITGGSRGIGRAIVVEMARNGADVAVVYAGNSAAAEAVCAEAVELGVRALAYQCDVGNYAATKAVCAQILADFSGVDILVNNAGIVRDKLALRMTEEDFDQVIAVNLKGAFAMIQHLMSALMRSPSGRIINISSISGMMGQIGQANYAAAKAGMIGLTKTIAREVARRQVTCNAIAPGFIQTDMTAELVEATREALEARVPLQRVGSVEDIAHAAVFLASDKAGYITGEVLKVDGGMYI
ncbi:MAG: 3-oxoacyl-[acyl-carrier-protein] reductase [Propionibacteriaceae bacterium]|jgi:3-oxoacyl-[acyl-carrier protein] reductase|nr:3-oxoacyl-[acyl-carrier-protein] reductase [Propionibacteriaceae bacterium]